MNRQSKRSASGNCKRRNLSRLFSCLIVWTVVILSIIGNWFVRHDEAWFLDKCEKLPSPLVYVLKYLGEPFADITDSFDITGEDVTYQTYSEIPSNNVFFAGAPVMPTSARSDVAILDKNEFVVAYSHSLKHPVWCAYRIPRDKRHSESKRPSFKRDKNIESCPAASSYARTGYDRGHMVPNYAISTRYGETAQAKTFLMSNISPPDAGAEPRHLA